MWEIRHHQTDIQYPHYLQKRKHEIDVTSSYDTHSTLEHNLFKEPIFHKHYKCINMPFYLLLSILVINPEQSKTNLIVFLKKVSLNYSKHGPHCSGISGTAYWNFQLIGSPRTPASHFFKITIRGLSQNAV